jgi:hypothetical protein
LRDDGRIAGDGAPVIRRIHKGAKGAADPLRGLFPAAIEGKRRVVEYEPDSELRDTETVPLTEPGGDRGVHPPRGAAARARCLDRRGQDRHWLRDRFYALFLQAAAAAPAGGDPRRYFVAGTRDGGVDGRYHRGEPVSGGLRPYPEMKPTGLPWLGDVPAHWEVRRIKTLLKEVDNRSKSGEELLLSLRIRQGLVDHFDAGGKLIPAESLVGFKLIEPGQVVMNRIRAAAGLFGVANVRGLVSPDYAVFEPKPDAYNPYLLQAFRLPSLA